MGELIAFVVLAVILLGSALMVVTFKNLVHSVLSLILVFFSVAGIFVVLNADFLAVVQVLVYAGGISILIVFGVMTVERENMKSSNIANKRFIYTLPVVIGIFLVTVFAALRFTWSPAGADVPQNTIEKLAPILLTNYVIPFEVAAILLTVALTGALVLVKEVKENGDKS